jgi:putative ubiquitin-RnfH superfamily antitoxin RatB of RatAB toxin-antitoxin module
MRISVCHVTSQSLTEITFAVSPGSTVKDVLTQARGYAGFAVLVDEAVAVGVYGKRLDLTALLSEGDRLELYRPLVVEPKVARRRRAAHRDKVRQTKNKVPIADRTV